MRTNPEQLATLLRHQLTLLEADPRAAGELPALMIWGPPGVGKSAIVRSVAEEAGIGFIDIRLAQREPVDLRGLPVPNNDKGLVEWLLSSDWPRDPKSRGILLFDELPAADRTLQVAAYELILDRRLGDLYQLPPGWLVVAAGNRSEDRAVAHTLSSALANRFCHLNLEPDLESWLRWASGEGLHPDVIAFLRFRPECFFSMEGNVQQGWPSPRSWTRVAWSLSRAETLPAAVRSLLIHGLVGEGAGVEFEAFRDWALKLPDIPAMLAGRAPIQIPTRADQRYAFCAGLVHALWQGIEDEAIAAQPAQQRIGRFFAISQQLSADFATLTLLDAMQGRSEQSREARTLTLFSHAGFEAWSAQHGRVFEEHLALQMQALAGTDDEKKKDNDPAQARRAA